MPKTNQNSYDSQFQLPDKLNSNETKHRQNVIQRQYEIHAQSLNRQEKFLLNKGNKYKNDLKENAKRIQDFKKIQFNTELKLQEDRLKKLVFELNHPNHNRTYPFLNNMTRSTGLNAKTALAALPCSHTTISFRSGSLILKSATKKPPTTTNNKQTKTGALSAKNSSFQTSRSNSQYPVNLHHHHHFHHRNSTHTIIDEKTLDKIKDNIRVDLLMRFQLKNSDFNKNELEAANTTENKQSESENFDTKSLSTSSSASFMSDYEFDKIYKRVQESNGNDKNESSKHVKNDSKNLDQTIEMIQKDVNLNLIFIY
jgi:hypothetical protein